MSIRTLPGWKPVVAAALLAGFCALLLHARVYTAFERLRFGIVSTPLAAEAGAVTVPLPDLSRLTGQPAAAVLRLSADRTAPRVVRVSIGGAPPAAVPLAPGGEVRVDLGLPDGRPTAGDRVELTGDGDGWALTYLEVANVHGFSRGLFEFMIVPASARAANPAGVLLSVVLFVLMLSFSGAPVSAVPSRRLRAAYVAAAVLALLFLTLVLAAPFVSDYGVLLAWHTFLVLLVMLYLPTVDGIAREVLPVLRDVLVQQVLPAAWAAAVWFFRTLRRISTAIWRQRVPLLYLASAGLFLFAIARFHDPRTGFTFFISFGSQFEERLVPALRDVPLHVEPDSSGYDGQFYAQLAVDPLLLDPATGEALDSVSYRARRILFSATAFLLGLGQPRLIVHAYAMQNVLFWAALALLMLRWFPARDFRSFCLWFGCLFGHGATVSVVKALPDGPSLLLLALAVLAIEQGRTGRAAALASVAGLAKDSNLIWSAVVLDPNVLRGRRRWRRLCRLGLLAAGPLALWMLFLWAGNDFSNPPGGHRNFAAPLTAYAATWSVTISELREGVEPFAWFKLVALISLTTQAFVLIAVRAWNDPWWRAGMTSCALMVFLGPAVWEGYPVAAVRVLLPMTVAYNAVLPRGRGFWPLFVLGNLTVLPGLETLGVFKWPETVDAIHDLVREGRLQ